MSNASWCLVLETVSGYFLIPTRLCWESRHPGGAGLPVQLKCDSGVMSVFLCLDKDIS